MLSQRVMITDSGDRQRSLCWLLLLVALTGGLDAVAQTHVYPWPADDVAVIGEVRVYTTAYEDTFASIARAQGVGYNALLRLNSEVDPWLPGADQQVVLPTQYLLPPLPREGVVVNLSELRLYHFDSQAGLVSIYPIGIGTEGTQTPIMSTRVLTKIANPTWYPPESIRARHAAEGDLLPRQVPPGPENPLGAFAVQLERKGYFIHGTNQPIGVGRRVSSGCIRMYEPHISDLVHKLAKGSQVRVIRQPYKVAWHEGDLYMEAHPPEVDSGRDHSGFVAQIIKATSSQPIEVDWPRAFEAARAGLGLPVKISL
jgi:L,D-transpeptidase ErfK/SrfK